MIDCCAAGTDVNGRHLRSIELFFRNSEGTRDLVGEELWRYGDEDASRTGSDGQGQKREPDRQEYSKKKDDANGLALTHG